MPLAPLCPACGRAIACGSLLGGGSASAACSTSPRLRGEVGLRAEPWRREANRVRGLVHKLRLAATPPHQPPGTSSRGFAALGIRPLPARGERWRKWQCLASTRRRSVPLPVVAERGWTGAAGARHAGLLHTRRLACRLLHLSPPCGERSICERSPGDAKQIG